MELDDEDEMGLRQIVGLSAGKVSKQTAPASSNM